MGQLYLCHSVPRVSLVRAGCTTGRWGLGRRVYWMHFPTLCNPAPIIRVFISPLMSLQILTFVPRYINVCTCLTCIHQFLRENSLMVLVSLLLFWIYRSMFGLFSVNPLPSDSDFFFKIINPLKAELNPICHPLTLLGAHHIFHVSGLRVKRFC